MRIKSKKSQREYGLLNSSDLKAAKYKLLYGIMYAIMIIIALVCLVPVIWVALSGFKETKEMYAIPPTFFPKSIDLSKIPEIISKVNFGKYIFNTFILKRYSRICLIKSKAERLSCVGNTYILVYDVAGNKYGSVVYELCRCSNSAC